MKNYAVDMMNAASSAHTLGLMSLSMGVGWHLEAEGDIRERNAKAIASAQQSLSHSTARNSADELTKSESQFIESVLSNPAYSKYKTDNSLNSNHKNDKIATDYQKTTQDLQDPLNEKQGLNGVDGASQASPPQATSGATASRKNVNLNIKVNYESAPTNSDYGNKTHSPDTQATIGSQELHTDRIEPINNEVEEPTENTHDQDQDHDPSVDHHSDSADGSNSPTNQQINGPTSWTTAQNTTHTKQTDFANQENGSYTTHEEYTKSVSKHKLLKPNHRQSHPANKCRECCRTETDSTPALPDGKGCCSCAPPNITIRTFDANGLLLSTNQYHNSDLLKDSLIMSTNRSLTKETEKEKETKEKENKENTNKETEKEKDSTKYDKEIKSKSLNYKKKDEIELNSFRIPNNKTGYAVEYRLYQYKVDSEGGIDPSGSSKDLDPGSGQHGPQFKEATVGELLVLHKTITVEAESVYMHSADQLSAADQLYLKFPLYTQYIIATKETSRKGVESESSVSLSQQQQLELELVPFVFIVIEDKKVVNQEGREVPAFYLCKVPQTVSILRKTGTVNCQEIARMKSKIHFLLEYLDKSPDYLRRNNSLIEYTVSYDLIGSLSDRVGFTIQSLKHAEVSKEKEEHIFLKEKEKNKSKLDATKNNNKDRSKVQTSASKISHKVQFVDKEVHNMADFDVRYNIKQYESKISVEHSQQFSHGDLLHALIRLHWRGSWLGHDQTCIQLQDMTAANLGSSVFAVTQGLDGNPNAYSFKNPHSDFYMVQVGPHLLYRQYEDSPDFKANAAFTLDRNLNNLDKFLFKPSAHPEVQLRISVDLTQPRGSTGDLGERISIKSHDFEFVRSSSLDQYEKLEAGFYITFEHNLPPSKSSSESLDPGSGGTLASGVNGGTGDTHAAVLGKSQVAIFSTLLSPALQPEENSNESESSEISKSAGLADPSKQSNLYLAMENYEDNVYVGKSLEFWQLEPIPYENYYRIRKTVAGTHCWLRVLEGIGSGNGNGGERREVECSAVVDTVKLESFEFQWELRHLDIESNPYLIVNRQGVQGERYLELVYSQGGQVHLRLNNGVTKNCAFSIKQYFNDANSDAVY